jgi:arylsulfatase A-like enzyme/Tfp pilus assembly protein PilF
VVLVSIDTLRADRLPLHGYAAGRTPALDALAREAVAFEAAYSHCPLTLPAHASLFTGLLPPRHGVRDNIGFTLAAERTTLAARFKAAGYRTGGAVSAYVLRGQTGIAQGFDYYEDAIELAGAGESLATLQRDGAVAVDALGAWVEAQGEAPFFAFLHLYEPHWPYTPPAAHRGHAQPYDGEVAHADELLGRFLDRLRGRGLLDRALVAVTADHGEGLGDHGEAEHGIFLYREALHVPLLVRLPGGARGGARVAGAVGHADLAPTLLDLAGLDGAGMDGASLREALRTGRAPGRPVYAETLYPRLHFGWSDLYAATEGRFRFIRAPRPELYDLAADPGERRNLAAAKGAAAAGMAAWLEKQVASAAPAAPEEVSAETREKLQALGYIGAGAPPVAAGEALPDPKDTIGAYEELKRGIALRQQERHEEAVAQLRKVLSAHPRMLDAWELLALSLMTLGRAQEGIAALVEALELAPERAETHLALARAYALEGDLRRALSHAEIASARNPGQGFEVLAQLFMDKGDLARAADLARRSVAADRQRIMSHFILGVTAQRAGRYEEALLSFRRAEEAKRLRPQAIVRNLHANMGDCLARLGRAQEAEKEFQAEIAAQPRSREGRVGLATLYRSQGRDDEARRALAGLLEADPQADAYWTVVRTLLVLGDTAEARRQAAQARARFPADARFR